jgi:predicted PurR-regulated permease PerM
MGVAPFSTLPPRVDVPRTDPNSNLRRLLLVAAVTIAYGLVPFASGLVGSLILYTLTRPRHAQLSRRLGVRGSAAVVTVGVLIILLIPGGWLVSTITDEARSSLARLNIDDFSAWIQRLPVGSLDLTKELSNVAANAVSWLSGHAAGVVGSVTAGLLNLLIALFGLYYLLIDAEPLWQRAKRFLPVTDATADALAVRFVDVTNALLLGTLLTAAVQGTLVGIGFAIVGFHPPILWGFVTACVSVLPLLGSALVWLPGVVILAANHRPGAAVFLLILGAGVVSNLDNLMRPLIYRRVSGIHPMLTIVGAFAGVRLFGLIGVFLGPLVLSYFFELLAVYDDERRAAIDPPAVTA